MSKAIKQDTICALSTPPGVGAIGMVRISGTNAISIINKIFKGQNLEKANPNTIHFGKIMEKDIVIDEVLVSVFKAPNSYTGEDTIEISGHGSPYIMQRILKLLIKNGARQASPGEFTQRSFLNGKMDLSQAEAVADLIASSSNASHTIAMKQMRGGYSEEIEILRQQLLDFSSLIELELDFSEEDVEFADRSELTKLIDKIQSVVVNLLDSFDLGNAIKNGVPVVIAGSPNTGKSTLLNTLLKDDRAIVSNIPGTTRDTIEEEITIDGINFRFVDTAGIRETTDTIEAIGVKKSLEMINASAIVLYMFDVHELTARSLHQIVDEVRSNIKGMKAKLIWVGNKIDKENIDAIKHEYEEFRNVVFISARNKTNIDKLIKVLVQKANSEKTSMDQAIVSNVRHFEALSHAFDDLKKVKHGLNEGTPGDLLAMDIRSALDHLGQITGQVTNDELLGNIFGRFCIGK